MWVRPVVLEGRSIRIEPLAERHAASILESADPETFRYHLTAPTPWDQAGALSYVRRILGSPDRIAFAIVDAASGALAGSSSYFDIREQHRSIEIGHTWISPALRGTHVNPESKLLMLSHAFEVLLAERVQLKTDGRNVQSQAAMRKLGLTFEGVLRKHMILPDGFVRDTHMFSAIRDEWPELKCRLIERLGWDV
jgi:RimJ/RimL family protein N-acetyltransferase